MAVRTLQRSLLATIIAATAFIAVGLSAPSNGLFSIAIHPIFWRVDAAAIAESRASALGVDIDVRLGGMHLHIGWSALPLS
jgi:hypothetical protein